MKIYFSNIYMKYLKVQCLVYFAKVILKKKIELNIKDRDREREKL